MSPIDLREAIMRIPHGNSSNIINIGIILACNARVVLQQILVVLLSYEKISILVLLSYHE
jgi:hypothetical protein